MPLPSGPPSDPYRAEAFVSSAVPVLLVSYLSVSVPRCGLRPAVIVVDAVVSGKRRERLRSGTPAPTRFPAAFGLARTDETDRPSCALLGGQLATDNTE